MLFLKEGKSVWFRWDAEVNNIFREVCPQCGSIWFAGDVWGFYIYKSLNIIASEPDILYEFLDFIYVALCSKQIKKNY